MTDNKSLDFYSLENELVEFGDNPSGVTRAIILNQVSLMIDDQRTKDIQKISYHAGIPVEVLEGYLRSKD